MATKSGPSTPGLDKSSTYGESEETYYTSRSVSISVSVDGSAPASGDWSFLTVFNGQVILELKWRTGDEPQLLEKDLPLDLKEAKDRLLITEKPLIFLLRTITGKPSKEPDPLQNLDNRAGATVDLFPLLLGEEIFLKLPLVYIDTGKPTECMISARVAASEPMEEPISTVPLLITMVSAHCLPLARDGTYYAAAVCLDGLYKEGTVKFGISLSSAQATHTVWATASTAGQAGNTAFSAPNDDTFVPEDLTLSNTDICRSFYWNAMNRRLVDPNLLREWLYTPFLLEVAGVPKTGKVDVRGRYMCFVDATALLQPGVCSVSVCARLLCYSEAKLPDNVGGLLDLPPASGRVSARDTDLIFDEYAHESYVTIKFDLTEPLVPEVKVMTLFDTIGLEPREGLTAPIDRLEGHPAPEDPTIDVRKIRKEGGALAVHKELSGLACRGAVPMNQGIRRTAANRLLMRVRSMLRQFPPGDGPLAAWQDAVSAQHAAARRAVAASFAPQPPPVRAPPRSAAARCRAAGDTRISHELLKIASKNATSPRYLISKALRLLEERRGSEVKDCIVAALAEQPRNRFLLWMFAGQQFDKGKEALETAVAALRISVSGDHSDGTADVIGWGALHALYHFDGHPYAAFVAARKMRKSFELPSEWGEFYERWIEESGEEEAFWIPTVVTASNPFLIVAAFFLCLRCYTFCESALICAERGCAGAGSRLVIKSKMCPDIYYVRAASLLLRRHLEEALALTSEGIGRFGPKAMLCQMKTMCLSCIRGWDGECEAALECTERTGAEPCPALLLRGALGGRGADPAAALQRAARAHRAAPSGHSALALARLLAGAGAGARWAAAAVRLEPRLADGWALLALAAARGRGPAEARALLRTARQAGPLSPDIEEEVTAVMNVVQLETLPESLVKKLCFCEYY